jgi:uncharacterized protein YndB with AHSA1/START domain
MAHNEIHVDAPPAAVFEVLADPRLYGNWVVGASTTLAVEGRWPEPGATLHHVQAFFLRDTTTVLACEPERRLVLEARARPIVIAEVDIRLAPEGDGTRATMDEVAKGGLLGALPKQVSDRLLYVRNIETMRRLKRLAEIGYVLGRAEAVGQA